SVHRRSSLGTLTPARLPLPPQLSDAATRGPRSGAAQAEPAARLIPSPAFSGNLVSGSISLSQSARTRPMASVTAPSTPVLPLPASPSLVRIEPLRTAFELRFGELWRYRELLYFFVWRDVKVRYKQTVIGVAWVVLQPLLTMLVFTLFFGRLAKLPSAGLPYPVFYFSALVPWISFSTALQATTNVVVDNQRVITKVYFPRLVLPISSVLAGLVDFSIGFVVLVIFLFSYGINPTSAALWLPLFVLLAIATALGVGLWLA